MSLVRFRAKNHRQQVKKKGADEKTDERITPDSIFDPLNAIHGFTLDAAANSLNTKVPDNFCTTECSGLIAPWAGEIVWCNPPYSNLGAWCEKAFREMANDCLKVVMLLPANRTEQRWWQDWIEPVRDLSDNCVTTKFLKGRYRFGWPAGRIVPKKGDRPPFGLVVVTVRGVSHG